VSHLVSFFIGTIVAVLVIGQSGKVIELVDGAFTSGYERGRVDALRLDPPNADLETACAALWLYDQHQRRSSWTR
jgi:hypothetical protein